MVKDMKEFLLMLMETNILVIGKLMKIGITHSGTEQDMTKKETSQKNLRKVSVKVFSVNGSS